MNEGHYQPQGNGYDGRAAEGRDRRDQYQQQTYQQPPPQSPPTSASPFAFAPPPLSSIPASGTSRPVLSSHHSEPAGINQQYPYYQQTHKIAGPTYPTYATSAPMAYRTYSGETERQSPIQPPLTRTPSLSIVPTSSVPSQSSPITASSYSPYAHTRQIPTTQYGTPASQTQSSPRAGVYPSSYYTTPYSQPSSADMPRSLSYPSNYSAPYPTYLPSVSAPSTLQQPPLLRHNTMAASTIGMDMRQNPNLGYSFANRLPLVDRPFKCDECVQSFNRNHDLKRHKRIHLDVKPFGCDKCGKTFSRKDALRRHWLVKGCRGEEGATAPITPMYPINSQPPALSPPTPEHPSISPTDHVTSVVTLPATSSFSHPSAPPNLSSLPPRDSSEPSQIIVTPDEIGQQQQQQMARVVSDMGVPQSLAEPLVIDTSLGRTNSSMGETPDGYFEGVVGLKQDGSAMLDNSSGNSSPFTRFPSSPSNATHHHPYRRPSAMPSPGQRTNQSPIGGRTFAPGSLGADGKPVFAMPFTPSGQSYSLQQTDGLLAPPLETGAKMEKTLSADAMPESWQRWHRPSFPFPAPPGVGYTYDPSSPIDVGAQGFSQ
ncbi:hypothetical protein L486_00031 [Kwoniella mangroviensis CBS 10435]|uniref:C2H2-type domain-containing protein n=1 Tax=Kwoniella mangroviensis CBS 10435 TaxID=1331196 RepID=A0A1B9IXZ7_9TREE|nr:hypothetical protein L486_00031 [Kwoniella mangroviensis CBS 10435]